MHRFISRSLATALLAGAAALVAGCTDDATASTTQLSSGSGSDLGSGSGCQHPPPQAAIAACANSSAGATCSFSIDGHSIDGACKADPRGEGPLACAPDSPPPPPQAAVDACSGETAGASCSFSIDGNTVSGTCTTGPDGNGPLACAPVGGASPPPPH